MRLWTIQPFEVWEQLERSGELLVDEVRLSDDAYVPPAYRWLAGELGRRVSGYPGTLPWWAYCQKPDLRLFRHSRPAGQRELRIELEPAAGSFVTFPIWAWDTVYCGLYLAVTAGEHARWSAALPDTDPNAHPRDFPDPWKSELRVSWSRLFDPELPRRPWDPWRIGQSGSCEAVLGVLRLEDVRGATPFVGSGRVGR
ncbi:MAG: DUF3841 domain-containing protein [Armatimonadota bacterium]